MIGWNAGAMFNVAGIPMIVTNWHETEFNRNEGYEDALIYRIGYHL